MSLLTNLMAYWKMEEATGNRFDEINANTLVESGGGSHTDTGIIGQATKMVLADSGYFSLADNADVSTGDISFTVQVWVKFNTLTTNGQIVNKASSDGATEEFRIDYLHSSTRFRGGIKDSAGNYQVVTGDTIGAPSTGVWYHVLFWHDSSANTVNLQINNGTVDSVATANLGPVDTSAPFVVARIATGNYWDGWIDEMGFWKRTLNTTERNALWGGGSGLAFSGFGGVGSGSSIPVFMSHYQQQGMA